MDEKAIRDQCGILADLMVAKNHDYGDSMSRSPFLVEEVSPRTAILVRMSDKLERLRSLLYREDEACVSTESLEDTVRDLAGYCIGWLCQNDDESET